MSVYISPSFGQPGVSVSYRPKSLLPVQTEALQSSSCPTITIDVPPASIHHIFAHRQWRAGMLMSDAISTGAFPLDDCTVLELGAGTGLPCITACHQGSASAIVCSDYDEPELIRALRANVKANLPSDARRARSIKVVGHIWGTNTDDLVEALPSRGVRDDRFDVVLLADCLWDPLSHAVLLKTVVGVLARTAQARIHVVAGLHTGREKIVSFLRRAHRAGLALAPTPVPDLWPPLPSSTNRVDELAGDEAFAQSLHHILELQVCGEAAVHSPDGSSASDKPANPPGLSGERRPFSLNGSPEETDVHERNRWLTVWSLKWDKLPS